MNSINMYHGFFPHILPERVLAVSRWVTHRVSGRWVDWLLIIAGSIGGERSEFTTGSEVTGACPVTALSADPSSWLWVREGRVNQHAKSNEGSVSQPASQPFSQSVGQLIFHLICCFSASQQAWKLASPSINHRAHGVVSAGFGSSPDTNNKQILPFYMNFRFEVKIQLDFGISMPYNILDYTWSYPE